MFLKHLELLCCPLCRGELRINDNVVVADENDSDKIIEARLRCEGCEHAFDIDGGIPQLLPDIEHKNQLYVKQVYEHQWTNYDYGTVEENRLEFYKKTSYRDAGIFSITDGVFLDAGIGSGRFFKLFREDFSPKLSIGVDISSSSVNKLYKDVGHHRDVLIVQGHLGYLPIKKNVVDIAQSIGVIHHTSHPLKSFSNIGQTVKPGGKFQIKVYNRLPFYFHYPFLFVLRLFTAMPHRIRIALVNIVSSILYPFQSLILKMLGEKYGYFRAFPQETFAVLIHDFLSPKITNWYKEEEIKEWFVREGFDIVRIGNCPVSVLGQKRSLSTVRETVD